MLAASVTDKLQTEKIQESIHEGFDPVLNINELFIEHGKRGIEAVYEGGRDQPFAQFFANFKKIGVNAVGKVMEEIEEGFVNGEDDVWAFVDYNLTEQALASAPRAPPGTPPGMAESMVRMKTQQQMAMLKKALVLYKQQNGQAQPVQPPVQQQPAAQPRPVPAQPQSAPIKPAETPQAPPRETAGPVELTPAMKHEANWKIIMQKYGGILAADQARLREDEPEQNAHSRAYASTCSFTK